MYVKVTTAGDGLKFLGPNRKAFPVSTGQTVEIMSSEYAQSLIESGFAEAAVVVTATVTAVLAPPTADDPKPETAIIAELVEVNGIGEATAKKLVGAGIQSVSGLINADATELARALDVTETTVKSWQAAANQLLEDE